MEQDHCSTLTPPPRTANNRPCCGNSCRHCPWGHVNVPKDVLKDVRRAQVHYMCLCVDVNVYIQARSAQTSTTSRTVRRQLPGQLDASLIYSCVCVCVCMCVWIPACI
ncbi:hypothetical protein T492DRAFT_85537 [Pavlovales sp. CCMP2436]|nr:hypothetical protein T492DRAFT_85537 [Pavlovales sp. CCMP2436]